MNLVNRLRPARKILTATAVAALAATCMVSANTTNSAAAQQRADVAQATKEWKAPTPKGQNVVLATKEWKALRL